MGFPVGYTEVFLPKLLVHTLSFLGFIRNLISAFFNFLGLTNFLETDAVWLENPTQTTLEHPPVSALLILEILPVIKYEELVIVGDPPESCVVCLYEFQGGEEIRWLRNCSTFSIGHVWTVGWTMIRKRVRFVGRHSCPMSCKTSLIKSSGLLLGLLIFTANTVWFQGL
ncbi:hypothetical protein GOBAR_AA15884 [Gossypium barbadense]|uniref:Uncharacterized protein n=1 Tax=Gossypium barbadense TaxID=3634 RepID=A0A2P5XN78_GOSBA|nr:hypothetical protein GOBAR_AA15884 [Gossypium barbadense]